MIEISNVFWYFIFLFAAIGALRGWAKELLVIFSLLLALFLNTIVEQFVPGFREAMASTDPRIQFYGRAFFFVVMAFFGYQTPNLSGTIGGKAAPRDKLQSSMLGFVMGALNGWLLLGTIWYYLNALGYPLEGITAPQNLEQLASYIKYLPPQFVGVPAIYFAIGIAFVFVIIVFI